MCLLLYYLIIIPVKCYTESIILKVLCIFISHGGHIFTFVKWNLEKCLTFTLHSFICGLEWGLSWSILTKHCYWNLLINFKMNRAKSGLSMHLRGFKWKLCVCCGLHESIFSTFCHVWSTWAPFLLEINTVVYFSWDMRKVRCACTREEAYHV